ncbi:hypothetical protein D3C74_426270 [compost metagenome]
MKRKHVQISVETYGFVINQIEYLIDIGTGFEEWKEQVAQFFKDPVKEGNNRSVRYFLQCSFRYFDTPLYNQFDK